MQYYIEISSWNLLESFVTESISPFSFYSERNFGNNLSRYLSGEEEKSNYLILSTQDLPDVNENEWIKLITGQTASRC